MDSFIKVVVILGLLTLQVLSEEPAAPKVPVREQAILDKLIEYNTTIGAGTLPNTNTNAKFVLKENDPCTASTATELDKCMQDTVQYAKTNEDLRITSQVGKALFCKEGICTCFAGKAVEGLCIEGDKEVGDECIAMEECKGEKVCLPGPKITKKQTCQNSALSLTSNIILIATLLMFT